MPAKQTNTPIPWSYRLWSGTDEYNAKADALGLARVPNVTNDGARIIMADGHRIGTVDCITEYKRGKGHETECAERDANAALIVRAVNSHQDLIYALENCRYVLERMNAEETFPNILQVVNDALSKAKAE